MLIGVKTRAHRLVAATLGVLPVTVTAFLLTTGQEILAVGPRVR